MLKKISIVFWGILMVLILLYSKEAVAGAKNGIILCLYTVLPALFPFSVLSILFRSQLTAEKNGFTRSLEKMFNMPRGFFIIFLLGLMGGYPIGAFCLEESIKEKPQIRSSVKYLRAVCNNAGPSFIIGMTACCFSDKRYCIYLLVIQALSALMTCLLLAGNKDFTLGTVKQRQYDITAVLKTSCSAFITICGIIVMFSTFLNIMKSRLTGFFSNEIWVIITGLMELTSGISQLPELVTEELRFIVATGMLSFGGLCVTLQTISIFKTGLRYYLFGKILQATIAMTLAYMIMKIKYMSFVIYIFVFIVIKYLRKNKCIFLKNSSNSGINAV